MSQVTLKRAVEHGLKEIIQAAAGGGLLGLHGADVGHAGGELFLQREWRERHVHFSNLLERNAWLCMAVLHLGDLVLSACRECHE